MPYESSVNTLVEAGPFTTIAVALVFLTIVTLTLSFILWRTLQAFINVQKESNEQTRLMRTAVESMNKNHIAAVNMTDASVSRLFDVMMDNRIDHVRTTNLLISRIDNNIDRIKNIRTTLLEMQATMMKIYETVRSEEDEKHADGLDVAGGSHAAAGDGAALDGAGVNP